MKEFVKKYSVVIFLVVMIVILIFIKSFIGNKTNEIQTPQNTQTNIEQSTSIVETKKTEEVFEKLNEKYEGFENVDDRENWVSTLSSEEQKILAGEEAVMVTDLNNELPYEGNTFIIESVPSNSLLMAKSKIDDLEKAEADLRDWLSSKGMNFEELVIAWE